MSLSNPQMRAIEIMIEQMERLAPRLSHNHRLVTGLTHEEVVREFYNEETRLGRFELNYLNAIGKCLAPNPDPNDMIVTTEL